MAKCSCGNDMEEGWLYSKSDHVHKHGLSIVFCEDCRTFLLEEELYGSDDED